jgi:phosphoenolpyruvate carboxylase
MIPVELMNDRYSRLQETKPMTRTTTKPMYSHRSWTVQPNEDGYGYDVVDRDGEPYDWAETLQDACQLCQKEADEAYEEAVLSAVQEFEMSELNITSWKRSQRYSESSWTLCDVRHSGGVPREMRGT